MGAVAIPQAIYDYPKIADSKPLKLQGAELRTLFRNLNKAIDRAEGLLQT